MTPKKRVTTSATKAKLPLPANHPQRAKPKKRKPDPMGELDPRLTAVTLAHRKKVDRRREILKALGAQEMPSFTPNTPRAIPCGEDATTGTNGVWQTSRVDFDTMFPAAKRCDYLEGEPKGRIHAHIKITPPMPIAAHERVKTLIGAALAESKVYIEAMEAAQVPPPDTSAYPWPLKFAWRVDGWIVAARTALASKLSHLADKVKP